jgi:hypothetical protein
VTWIGYRLLSRPAELQKSSGPVSVDKTHQRADGSWRKEEEVEMEWSWLLTLLGVLVAVPSGVLAILQILDWRRKHRPGKRRVRIGEQGESNPHIKEQLSPMAPDNQDLGLMIRQAEMAAEVDKLMLQKLRQYEAEQRGGGSEVETLSPLT